MEDFAHETTAIFSKKCFLLTKDAKLVLNGKTRTSFTFMKNSREDFITGVSQNDLNCFKNRLGTCGFADRKFFSYKQS